MEDKSSGFYNKLNLKMNTPAIYQIKVQGSLNSSWSDSLSGMNITSYEQDEDVTTLVGKLQDQAALTGVLQALYESHFPILLVQLI